MGEQPDGPHARATRGRGLPSLDARSLGTTQAARPGWGIEGDSR